MAQIDLYGSETNPYTKKCRMGLQLKGLSYTMHEPEGPDDYKRWNPKTGLLPVMRVNGELVIDSTDILRRLDEVQAEPALLSPDAAVAEQQLNLEDWADESFLYYFQRWLRYLSERPEPKPQRGPRIFREVGAWLAAGGTWERPQTAILRGIDDRLKDLVRFLGSRRFFYADNLSMADLAVYAMLWTLRNQAIEGASPLLLRQPELLAFMQRVEETTGE